MSTISRCTSLILALLLISASTQLCLAQSPLDEIVFRPVKIDGPVHDPAKDSYWFGPFSETASVLDVDNDGDYDIAAGRNWYEAPNWIKHSDFRSGAETNGPETESNSEFAMDVDGDGWEDVVSSGWMFMKGAFWYQNPQNKPGKWKSYRMHHAYNMEGVIHGDIDGDGDEDILVNHWNLVDGQGMTWIEHLDEAPYWKEYVVGREGDTHGNGLGDVNMDGNMDIVTGQGWYEQPTGGATVTPWKFHADWKFQDNHTDATSTAHPNMVYDVNEDGLNDVIIGSGHAYGIVWMEQHMQAGERSWTEHWIEKEFSQFHTMAMADLNGDGKPDLVTGKRLMAHYGGDVGAFEPLFVFWYDIDGGNFNRHILSYNYLPYYPNEGGKNPVPNMVVGTGMKINIKDMDHDGDNDVILAGKGGLYVFYNEGRPSIENYANALPKYSTYSTWRDWARYKTLFNTKDFTNWKLPEGDGGHWKIVDSNIDYDASSEAEDKHLWTEKDYRNYRLHVEWRFKEASGIYENMPIVEKDGSYRVDENGNQVGEDTPNSDSGIMFRGESHQANIWNWNVGSGELWAVRTNKDNPPDVLAAAVPKVKADNPIGEWNTFDIKLIDDRVWIMLNGEQIIENALLPGLPERGPIGLQHHGGWDKDNNAWHPTSSLIQFRNIWIEELPDDMSPEPVADDAWQSLFNGENLDGWIVSAGNQFAAENGELTVKRENPDGQEHNFDYLWTEEQYDDFVLELEFKVIEGTNSGVFFRTPDLLDPVYTGLEIQIADSYSRSGLSKTGTAGALYDAAAPTKNAINKPGEWNHYRLTCNGSRVQVDLNGQHIVDVDLAQWTTPNMNPDGTPNKFANPLVNFARNGHIGLQDHGKPVWYRNLRVKRIPERTDLSPNPR